MTFTDGVERHVVVGAVEVDGAVQRGVRFVADGLRRTLLPVARVEPMGARERLGVALVFDVVPDPAERAADGDRSAIRERDTCVRIERHREIRIQTVRRSETRVDGDERTAELADATVRHGEEVAERDLDRCVGGAVPVTAQDRVPMVA